MTLNSAHICVKVQQLSSLQSSSEPRDDNRPTATRYSGTRCDFT